MAGNKTLSGSGENVGVAPIVDADVPPRIQELEPRDLTEAIPTEPSVESPIDSFDSNAVLENVTNFVGADKADKIKMVEVYDAKLLNMEGFASYEPLNTAAKDEFLSGLEIASSKVLTDVKEAIDADSAAVQPLDKEFTGPAPVNMEAPTIDAGESVIDTNLVATEAAEAKPKAVESSTKVHKTEEVVDIDLDKEEAATLAEIPVAEVAPEAKAEPEPVVEAAPTKEPIVAEEAPKEAEGAEKVATTETPIESDFIKTGYENPYVKSAETEARLLIKHELAPESTFASLRKHTPRLLHNLIDKMEAKSETKTVNSLYAELSSLTAKRGKAELAVKQSEEAFSHYVSKLDSIKKDPLLTEGERALALKRMESEQPVLEARIANDKQELAGYNTRYDLNRAEMRVYEGRRNEAVERVTEKLNVKIEPRKQKLEELHQERAVFQKDANKFSADISHLKSEVARFQKEAKANPKQEKYINKAIGALEKQINIHTKLLDKQLKKAYKLDAKIIPLEGTLNRWQMEKKSFDGLHDEKSIKYGEREEAEDEEKAKIESVTAEAEASETAAPEASTEAPVSEPAAETDATPEEIIDVDVETSEAKREAEPVVEGAAKEGFEKEPNTFAEYVSSWNKYAESHKLSPKMKFDTIEDKNEVIASFKRTSEGEDFDEKDLLPKEMQNFFAHYSEIKLRQDDEEKAIAIEKEEDPSFKVSDKWRENWGLQWNRKWYGRKSLIFGGTEMATYKKAARQLYKGYYAQVYGIEI